MKHTFQIKSLIRLILLAAFSVGTTWAVVSAENILPAIPGIIIVIILIFAEINQQIKRMRRINYFFEAVGNEDSHLTFPAPKNNELLRHLSQNIEKVNQHIRQLKIESRQQEQYFRTLIEHVDAGILSFDENGFVLHANKSFKRIMGLEQLTHLKQLNKIDTKLANAVNTIRPNEQKMITFDAGDRGHVSLVIKAVPLVNNNQHIMLLSVQDINQQLNEKELDSWLKLIRVLTHEIMNSIAPVTSLSENIRNYYDHNGQPIPAVEVTDLMIRNTIRGLNVIEEQGKGLIRFVETYRQLTRLPTPDLKPVNIAELLKNTVLLHKSSCPKIKISMHLSNSELQILVDEKMIGQVLVNLLKNAAEALHDKTDAAIQIKTHQNEKKNTEIQIIDNGPGIPPELMNQIFVPFFTTRDKGSGIGLSLSRQIMRLHGGSLNVRSVPGKKTTFSIEFRNQ